MDRKRTRFVCAGCLCLALGTLALYIPAARNPFLGVDDPAYVTENAYVRAGVTWETLAWSFTATAAQNWHPLTWVSHALDCQLYGLNPAGHHFTNILLHALNAVLLFLLLARFTASKWRSLLVAALFAIHPLNVESVAWIAERKNVLSTFLFLLTLGAYGWYARKPDIKRYLVVAVLFVLGLASKPMVITLPFVLLLLDFWPVKRIRDGSQPAPSRVGKNRKARSQDLASKTAFPVAQVQFWRLVLEKLPLLALSVGSAVITIIAQRTGAIQSLEIYPLGGRLNNAIYSYASYLWKAFWPPRLAFLYPYPRDGHPGWALGLALLFLGSVTAVVWKQRFGRRYLAVGWLWYLGTLFPVIGLIQVGDQAMADRYAYVPLIGIFVMVVWGLADWAEYKKIDFRLRAAAVATILAALSLITWRQIGYWHSDYDLWSRTVKVTQNNLVADEVLSKVLMTLGRFEEALPGFKEAAKLNPGDPNRHVMLAADLLAAKRLEDAIGEYEAAILTTPDRTVRARCYESIATIDVELGDFPRMRENYRLALEANPQEGAGMIDRLSQYAASAPSGPVYLQLGVLLQDLHKLPQARAAYQQALKLAPTLAAAKQSLDALERGNQ
jgi:tetratricopeptide (TPR) repeat protein